MPNQPTTQSNLIKTILLRPALIGFIIFAYFFFAGKILGPHVHPGWDALLIGLGGIIGVIAAGIFCLLAMLRIKRQPPSSNG